VLVTANYKLTFDAVRRELADVDAWLLVIDTRGINVWCAAGKELFSTEEIAYSIITTRLADIVSHREVILPQLSATGVAAHGLKKACGFKIVYGPVQAKDLPAFIQAGNEATEAMREVTFTLKQRAELIPVELFTCGKPLAIIIACALLVSGIGPGGYSLETAWTRGGAIICATLIGLLAGGALVPLLLPRLPWKYFSPKGLLVGAITALPASLLLPFPLSLMEHAAFLLWTSAVASYLAMNFTGATPFTSPTGVEKEMRRFIPIQAGMALIAFVIWLTAPFIG